MEDRKIVNGQIVCAPRAEEKQILARQMRRAMTFAEGRLWQALRANRLDGLHFRRQQVIDGFIADFYCREARLVIECDGGVHQARAEYDRERDRILATHNLHILRVPNAQIETNLNAVLAQIRAVVCQAKDPEPPELIAPELIAPEPIPTCASRPFPVRKG